MLMSPDAEVTQVGTFEQTRKFVLVFLACTLSVTVVLKIGEIQYLELILCSDFLILSVLFIRNGFRTQVFKPFLSIATSWGIFLILAFLFALVGLRQNFYSFSDGTLLKRPLLVTISRMVELFLDVFYMLYLASLYREDERLGRLGARTFYWMGILGSLYSFISLPLNLIWDLQLGAYANLHRFRGFNNEGGSYGTYLIGLGLLTVAMWRRGWLTRNEFRIGMVIFALSFVGSQSKAAFLACAIMGLINALILTRGRQRMVLIGGVIAGLLVFVAVFDFRGQINAYVQNAQKYQSLSTLRSDDGNLVMGRISGMVLSPRMIAAHPLTGIGWGNYPLVRDDPEYRRGTAFSLYPTDSPSLGPIDYIVELGFPLFFYLSWIELKPFYLLWKHHADIWILNLSVMQILANWFGAHLNLTYQWVMVGLALGMGFAKIKQEEDSPLRTIAA
jgi:hypothetical protein